MHAARIRKNPSSSHFTNMQLFFTQCSNVVRCESRKNGGGKMNGGCRMWHGNAIFLFITNDKFSNALCMFFYDLFLSGNISSLRDSLKLLKNNKNVCFFKIMLLLLILWVANRNSFFRCNILKSFILFFALIQCIDWWWKMLEAYFTHCCFSYPFILHSL